MAASDPRLRPLEHLPAIYLHVPFCRKKCPYCDFCSLDDFNPDIRDGILEQTLRQLESFLKRIDAVSCHTVYIGGGTPSLLPGDRLESFLAAVSRLLPGGAVERTIEANPESLDEEFLKVCAGAGINRLSLGLQSFQEGMLRALGRAGNAEDSRRALELAAKRWKGRWSADLLAGIPGQTDALLRLDLELLLQADPGHCSLYCLTVPPGSSLEVEPDRQEALWFEGLSILEARGYRSYEVSNFARPGQECLHNLHYWRLDPYLGAGLSAVSTLPALPGKVLRLSGPENPEAFLGGEKDFWGLTVEDVSSRELFFESAMMGLRLEQGIPQPLLDHRFGSLPLFWKRCWHDWIERGWAEGEEECFRLSPGGRLILDSLLVQLRGEMEQDRGWVPDLSWP